MNKSQTLASYDLTFGSLTDHSSLACFNTPILLWRIWQTSTWSGGNKRRPHHHEKRLWGPGPYLFQSRPQLCCHCCEKTLADSAIEQNAHVHVSMVGHNDQETLSTRLLVCLPLAGKISPPCYTWTTGGGLKSLYRSLLGCCSFRLWSVGLLMGATRGCSSSKGGENGVGNCFGGVRTA